MVFWITKLRSITWVDLNLHQQNCMTNCVGVLFCCIAFDLALNWSCYVLDSGHKLRCRIGIKVVWFESTCLSQWTECMGSIRLESWFLFSFSFLMDEIREMTSLTIFSYRHLPSSYSLNNCALRVSTTFFSYQYEDYYVHQSLSKHYRMLMPSWVVRTLKWHQSHGHVVNTCTHKKNALTICGQENAPKVLCVELRILTWALKVFVMAIPNQMVPRITDRISMLYDKLCAW